MIGLVRFQTHRGEPAEAILGADGRWRCPRLPVLERPLNVLYGLDREPPGEHPLGWPTLTRAAQWLRGTPERSAVEAAQCRGEGTEASQAT